jgi:uncharacterized FlgJ-related protein
MENQVRAKLSHTKSTKLVKSLRKGNTTVTIWHEFGSDTVGAVKTEVELKEGYAVFRTMLKPVDNNQKSDVDSVFLENITSLKEVTFDDAQIRQRTTKFLKYYKKRIDHIKLEITYNRNYLFSAILKPVNEDGLSFEIKA